MILNFISFSVVSFGQICFEEVKLYEFIRIDVPIESQNTNYSIEDYSVIWIVGKKIKFEGGTVLIYETGNCDNFTNRVDSLDNQKRISQNKFSFCLDNHEFRIDFVDEKPTVPYWSRSRINLMLQNLKIESSKREPEHFLKLDKKHCRIQDNNFSLQFNLKDSVVNYYSFHTETPKYFLIFKQGRITLGYNRDCNIQLFEKIDPKDKEHLKERFAKQGYNLINLENYPSSILLGKTVSNEKDPIVLHEYSYTGNLDKYCYWVVFESYNTPNKPILWSISEIEEMISSFVVK